MGLVGMATLVLIAVLFSSNRKAINVRTVVGAFAIQAGLGAFVLYVPVGRDILVGVSDAVSSVISYGQNGLTSCLAVWSATRCLKCSVAAALSLPSVFCRSSSSSLP